MSPTVNAITLSTYPCVAELPYVTPDSRAIEKTSTDSTLVVSAHKETGNDSYYALLSLDSNTEAGAIFRVTKQAFRNSFNDILTSLYTNVEEDAPPFTAKGQIISPVVTELEYPTEHTESILEVTLSPIQTMERDRVGADIDIGNGAATLTLTPEQLLHLHQTLSSAFKAAKSFEEITDHRHKTVSNDGTTDSSPPRTYQWQHSN